MRWNRNGLEEFGQKIPEPLHIAEIDRPAFGYAEEYDNNTTELYLIMNQNEMDEISKG